MEPQARSVPREMDHADGFLALGQEDPGEQNDDPEAKDFSETCQLLACKKAVEGRGGCVFFIRACEQVAVFSSMIFPSFLIRPWASGLAFCLFSIPQIVIAGGFNCLRGPLDVITCPYFSLHGFGRAEMMEKAWKWYTWSFLRHLAMLILFCTVEQLAIVATYHQSNVLVHVPPSLLWTSYEHRTSFEVFDKFEVRMSLAEATASKPELAVGNYNPNDVVSCVSSMAPGLCECILPVVNKAVVDVIGQSEAPVSRWVFRVLRFMGVASLLFYPFMICRAYNLKAYVAELPSPLSMDAVYQFPSKVLGCVPVNGVKKLAYDLSLALLDLGADNWQAITLLSAGHRVFACVLWTIILVSTAPQVGEWAVGRIGLRKSMEKRAPTNGLRSMLMHEKRWEASASMGLSLYTIVFLTSASALHQEVTNPFTGEVIFWYPAPFVVTVPSLVLSLIGLASYVEEQSDLGAALARERQQEEAQEDADDVHTGQKHTALRPTLGKVALCLLWGTAIGAAWMSGWLSSGDYVIPRAKEVADQLHHDAKSIFLASVDLDDASASAIAEALTASKAQAIILSTTKISDKGAMAFGKSLEQNTHLKELTLFDNKISDMGAMGLGKGLEQNKDLKELNLCKNKISDMGAMGLGKGLERNKHLKRLYLVNNKISGKGAMGLAKGLERNKHLKELDLSQNSISDEGAARVAEALERNKHLKELDLSSNQISDEGAVRVAKALERNAHLKELDLADNWISDEGAIQLAKALERNTHLKELDLSSNEISDEGAVHLAKALERNKDLKKLDLSDNEISDEGAVHLAKALKRNKGLKKLDLIGNKISDEGAVHLAKALERNKDLKKLVLDESRVSGEVLKQVHEALEKKKTGV